MRVRLAYGTDGLVADLPGPPECPPETTVVVVPEYRDAAPDPRAALCAALRRVRRGQAGGACDVGAALRDAAVDQGENLTRRRARDTRRCVLRQRHRRHTDPLYARVGDQPRPLDPEIGQS
jgi:hypothetical protein